MTQIITLKELEEKYEWGFVVFKNLQDYFDFPSEGEYVFHSQNKRECWDLLDNTNSQRMGVFPFGKNPKYADTYAFLSPFTLVREDSVDYKKVND